MPVVILCGGLGTRLREETEFKPKPMVEIGGKPILWHIMKHYAHFGFRKFIVCLGYKGNVIKDYFLNYEAMSNDLTISLGNDNNLSYQSNHTEQDFNITLVDTGLKTMTGGRIKRIEKFIDTDTFMVTYGDGLADVDINALVDFHQEHDKLATLTATRPPSRFGILDLMEGGQVNQFREKVQTEWINGGFFVFNRRVFDYLDKECVLEQEPIEKLAAEEQLMAHKHSGFWIGMDTFREYEMLNDMWDKGKAPWKLWGGIKNTGPDL
ncbi:MAG: glucose-1-phosphate cytidylyltransferase [Desulfobacteraceae bacterium]|nr:glucose-1-phosphate cytidylyltransferase [Desulfobacteraceae bacterium]